MNRKQEEFKPALIIFFFCLPNTNGDHNEWKNNQKNDANRKKQQPFEKATQIPNTVKCWNHK